MAASSKEMLVLELIDYYVRLAFSPLQARSGIAEHSELQYVLRDSTVVLSLSCQISRIGSFDTTRVHGYITLGM